MRAAALLLLALAGCRERHESAGDQANPLEAAARDAGLVVDAGATPPTGLFERVHSGGSDLFCAVADRDGYRFGLVARFGATLSCEGSGRASHSGTQLSLRFDGANCTIEARYDGGAIAMPGAVPDGCAALCGPRASLSGVAVERVAWSADDAARLRTPAGRSPCAPRSSGANR